MKSTIRVEYDFDEKSPYLQLRLEGHDEGNGDFKDKLMKNFIEESNQVDNELSIEYRGAGNYLPQIRIRRKGSNPETYPDTINIYNSLHWVGLNASSVWDQGPVYKSGQSYNLQFATGNHHHVYIKTLGENDVMPYEYFSDFTEQWVINPAKRT